MKQNPQKVAASRLLVPLTVLFLAPVAALAQANQLSTDPGGGNDNITGGVGVNDFTTGASESTGLTNTLMAVAHYALYVFLRAWALSLWELPRSNSRAGTWRPWARIWAAPSCLFLVPKIVEVIISWAQR